MKIAVKVLLICCALGSSAIAVALPMIEEGEIWAYKTRPGEEKSTLTILKIEEYPKYGEVVHIRVDDIQMINPATGAEFNAMPHMPFQAKALQRSLIRRVGKTVQVPEFNEGYAYWKSAFDEEKAGAFKISVRQALAGLLRGSWEAIDENTLKTPRSP